MRRLFSKQNMDNRSEIVNAYIKNITELPIITGANPRKVKEFYKQLRFNVQSLDTLGRLADVKGNVRCTLDKLKGIKADLVRGNEGWKDWGFKDLLKDLQKWDPNQSGGRDCYRKGQRKTQHGKEINNLNRPCLPSIHIKRGRVPEISVSDCEDDKHRAINCTKVTSVHERQKNPIREKTML